MPLPRFYISSEDLTIDIDDDHQLPFSVNISGGAVKHMTQVLRLKPGASLLLFNGKGGEYQAVLREVSKQSATLDIEVLLNRSLESGLNICLAQGVSRADRMDWTVQKSVELGVSHIVPVITDRTVVNLKGEHRERRVSHWQKVAISACEQCGRNIVPEVKQAVRFNDWLGSFSQDSMQNTLKLILHHEAEQGLLSVMKQVAERQNDVVLLVGPEGGLSQQEQNDAIEAGFLPVKMGPRILRTETAAVVALSIIQSHWGDIA